MTRVIVVGLVVMALFVSSGAQAPTKTAAASDIGRYQIVNSGVNAATFLLDTSSGRVWVVNRYEDLFLEPTVWEPMERLNSFQEIEEFLKLHPKKSTLK